MSDKPNNTVNLLYPTSKHHHEVLVLGNGEVVSFDISSELNEANDTVVEVSLRNKKFKIVSSGHIDTWANYRKEDNHRYATLTNQNTYLWESKLNSYSVHLIVLEIVDYPTEEMKERLKAINCLFVLSLIGEIECDLTGTY